MPVEIYTDGSCIKHHTKDSSGPGGWGYIILGNVIMTDISSSVGLHLTSSEFKVLNFALNFNCSLNN